ncbi:hypothetical protein MAR_011806 [Mya arenaria]|uniref:G-protein coupled receptors family 1 profile domain-containing protein n=1 Tax=Mya arenaria TaxID=6604 RepID=A0ABY7FWT3_MYAAR|nr:hypothetical protein MAR_011806 [Mya arenaria]
MIVVYLCRTIKRRKALWMPAKMETSQNKAIRYIIVALVLLRVVFVITNIPPVNITLYCNQTFNFIMYVGNGKSFRRELLYILTCQPPESESTELMQTTKTTLSVNTQRNSVK